MAKYAASWFRNVALGGLSLSLVMVAVMELLQEAGLSLWLHVPLTGLVLTLMAGGALTAGVAWLEYQARSGANGQQAQ
jgi:hypothetical protein